MKKISFKLFTIITALAATSLTLASADDLTLNKIAGYRQWTRVTPEPVKVEVPTTNLRISDGVPLT
jgi:hypothetical protein